MKGSYEYAGNPKGQVRSQTFFSSFFFFPLEIQIMSTLFFLKVSVDNWSLRQFLHQSYPKQNWHVKKKKIFFFHLNSLKIFVVISFNSYFIPNSDKQMEEKNTSVKD